jgi:hypothetical protein
MASAVADGFRFSLSPSYSLLVKEALAIHSLVTPAQAGAYGPTAPSQGSSRKALQPLEKRGAAEAWVPAFAGKTISLWLSRRVAHRPKFAAGGKNSAATREKFR